MKLMITILLGSILSRKYKSSYGSKIQAFGDTIKELIKKGKSKAESNGNNSETSEEIVGLKNSLKDKSKKLSEAIKAQKDLANKLVDIESKVNGDNTNIGQKYKTANNKLNEKTREMKKMNLKLLLKERRISKNL